MVYERCIVPGKLFLRPRPRNDRRYEGSKSYARPEWQLLLVNRKIRKEAAEVLFTMNLCVFNYAGIEWSKLDENTVPSSTLGDLALDRLMWNYVKSASITFDLRGLVSEDALDVVNQCRLQCLKLALKPKWTSRSMGDRMEKAHKKVCRYIEVWDGIMDLVALRRFLQIDVSNCYCPTGCCRLVKNLDSVIDTLWWVFEEGITPTIEIVGTGSRAEREELFGGT